MCANTPNLGNIVLVIIVKLIKLFEFNLDNSCSVNFAKSCTDLRLYIRLYVNVMALVEHRRE